MIQCLNILIPLQVFWEIKRVLQLMLGIFGSSQRRAVSLEISLKTQIIKISPH